MNIIKHIRNDGIEKTGCILYVLVVIVNVAKVVNKFPNLLTKSK